MNIKTKIICTIGPASSSPGIIRRLISRGMNVARLNFSHGTHKEHLEKIDMVRSMSAELGKPVAILQDLCGPKIRVGNIPEPGIRLMTGQKIILTGDCVEGNEKRVSVSYPHLAKDVNPGDCILLADGMMELIVLETKKTDILCKVVIGGILTSHKGINLPTGSLHLDAITEKDRDDLIFGLEHDVDYVALSFVRSADDLKQLKKMIRSRNKKTPVIAKIEKHEALNNIEKIIEAADGIMVARGDLGVEIPLEQIPGIQKKLVKTANNFGKPVIIATQMLRSMVDSRRPTRAEATDVANAVLDGADALMLSEETASGRYPVEAVSFMAKIIKKAEIYYPHSDYLDLNQAGDIPEAVAYASCVLADHLKAAAIVATTRSGFTAKQISRFRPKTGIIALSPEMATIRGLCLYWGCLPGIVPEHKDTDERMEKAALYALETGYVSQKDMVVITSGYPVYAAGTTNMIQVKRL